MALELLVRATNSPRKRRRHLSTRPHQHEPELFRGCNSPLESGIKLAPRRAISTLRSAKVISCPDGRKKPSKNLTISSQSIPPPALTLSRLSYRHLGRFRRSPQYFEQGLKLDPHNASCLFNVGYIEAAKAIKPKRNSIPATLKANPDFADALVELANLRISAKRSPKPPNFSAAT